MQKGRSLSSYAEFWHVGVFGVQVDLPPVFCREHFSPTVSGRDGKSFCSISCYFAYNGLSLIFEYYESGVLVFPRALLSVYQSPLGGISHAVSILLSIRFYTLPCIISIQDWHCCTSSLFLKNISVMFGVFSLVPRPVSDTEKWVTRSQLSYNFCFTSSLSLFLASRLCAS